MLRFAQHIRQTVLLHFPIRRPWQRIEKYVPPREFVSRQPRPEPGVQLLATRLAHNKGNPYLPPCLVRDRNDGGIHNLWMGDQLGLNLRRINIDAAADEHLLPP